MKPLSVSAIRKRTGELASTNLAIWAMVMNSRLAEVGSANRLSKLTLWGSAVAIFWLMAAK